MAFSIAEINRTIARAVPDREALVHGERRLSFADIDQRTDRLANVLLEHGVTIHETRERLRPWQSGQDAVALYLYNGTEYLEGMLGAFKARAVPFNINYRYVEAELHHVLSDAGTRALIYHACFAPILARLLPQLPPLKLLLQVADGSAQPLLPGALDYERALADAASDLPDQGWSADDLYMLYTGGTTGMPKGVLWRQADSVIAQLAGRDRDGRVLDGLAQYARRASDSPGHRVMPTAPFMHGAGAFVAFNAWHSGNTVVVQNEVRHLDPEDVLATLERERVSFMLIIGDAFGRPLLKAAERGCHDLSSMRTVYNSGAVLSPQVKQGLLGHMPRARVVDGLGASETGPQALIVTAPGEAEAPVRFRLTDEAVVLADDRRTVLEPGHPGLGWLCKRGSVPLGYLGDRERTERTFPWIDGQRYVVGGDRVRLLPGGEVEFHGRESFTINSGGEKIFVEEVEQALKQHPGVLDVLVTGRPSERWGQEVVAIVQLEQDQRPSRDELLAAAAMHIARYKLPKALLFVPQVRRGANGKADYRWAREQAAAAR